jgi:hypothetical protein
MRRLNLLLGLLTMVTALVLPTVALACPSCQEAPTATSGGADEQGIGNAAAYNHSIYIMVGVPYLSFGIVGFMIYRGVKKNEAYLQENGMRP